MVRNLARRTAVEASDLPHEYVSWVTGVPDPPGQPFQMTDPNMLVTGTDSASCTVRPGLLG
jgi:hypothetical protein